MKTAFITGITGQDGSFLAELLLEKGYDVHGLVRRASTINTSRIDHIHDNPSLTLHYGDLLDGQRLTSLVLEICPDEIYNLGAQSHVRVSFDIPVETAMSNAIGSLQVFEAARVLNRTKAVRVYQASSSEMFGNAESPQNEETPFRPRSPYACAKVFAYHQAVNYREAYDMFVANGILFNHESERRGETFVTRKITRAAARIKLGLQERLCLGNLDACRDWGYAKDYVEAMWLMLQHDEPDDFVISTGVTHTVWGFAYLVFQLVDLHCDRYIDVHGRYMRPTEVTLLRGDASKAKSVLGWEPTTTFDQLIEIMVKHDLALATQENPRVAASFKVMA